MSGFSNFLTNFSGGSINSSSGTDLISKAIIVPSFNTDLHHVNDGFIFVSNMLIQFSATLNPSHITNSNTHTIYYPIQITNFQPFIVNCGTIMNVGTNNTYGCVMNDANGEKFNFRNGQNQGNISWIAISIAPTTPIYTSIRNAGTISNAISVAVSGIGEKQYICDNSNSVYKNSNYGYGGWARINVIDSSNFAPQFSKIVCSLDGTNVVCSNNTSLGAQYRGNFYSTDSGLSFTKINMPSNYNYNCSSIACNQDASIIYAISTSSGMVFKSINKGRFTLIHTFANVVPNDIATDFTGKYIFIAANSGTIHLSRDFGNNFGAFNVGSTINFNKITVDSTGQYSAATMPGGEIYITKDYWNTFTKSNSSTKSWTSITSNSKGTSLTATTSDTNDGIYYSNDYGMNWTKTDAPNNAPNNNYVGINMNFAGNIATAITSSNVYVSFNASN